MITAQEARDAAKTVRFNHAFKAAEEIGELIKEKSVFGSVQLPVSDIADYQLIKDDLINIFKTNGFNVREFVWENDDDDDTYLEISWEEKNEKK